MIPQLSNFNIRTYCIFYSKKRQSIILSSEEYHQFKLNKFLGGGLEFNEGPLQCIERELQEELHIQIDKKKLNPIYFTQSCFPSFLMNGDQVVLLYYLYDFDLLPIQQFEEIEQFQLHSEFKCGLYWLSLEEEYSKVFSSNADKECFEYLLTELK